MPTPEEQRRAYYAKRARRVDNVPRSRTVATRDMKKAVKDGATEDEAATVEDLKELERLRPKTRGECAEGIRPCPFISCKYSLYSQPTHNGGLKVLHPHLTPDEMDPAKSCALDVANEGGVTLEAIARLLNVTRERVRQMETQALVRLTEAGLLAEMGDSRVFIRPGFARALEDHRTKPRKQRF